MAPQLTLTKKAQIFQHFCNGNTFAAIGRKLAVTPLLSCNYASKWQNIPTHIMLLPAAVVLECFCCKICVLSIVLLILGTVLMAARSKKIIFPMLLMQQFARLFVAWVLMVACAVRSLWFKAKQQRSSWVLPDISKSFLVKISKKSSSLTSPASCFFSWTGIDGVSAEWGKTFYPEM